jgi:hypothetical protein
MQTIKLSISLNAQPASSQRATAPPAAAMTPAMLLLSLLSLLSLLTVALVGMLGRGRGGRGRGRGRGGQGPPPVDQWTEEQWEAASLVERAAAWAALMAEYPYSRTAVDVQPRWVAARH